MKVSLEFTNLAGHWLTKPKGYSLKVGEVYVTFWSGWELIVTDTREGYGHSVVVERYQTKPTQSMIRKAKKRVW